MTAGTDASPPILHFLWTSGPLARSEDPLPGEVARRLALWRDLAPDHMLLCWSWADCDQLLSGEAEGRRILDLAARCAFPAMRADLLRLAILIRLGGIWSDIKNRPRRAFLADLPAAPLVLTQHFPMPDQPDPGRRLCNSFLAAAPGSTLLQEVLDRALTHVEARRPGSLHDLTGGGLLDRIWRGWTGPAPQVVPWEVAWRDWMRRTPMRYNAGALHWSARQGAEPLYL